VASTDATTKHTASLRRRDSTCLPQEVADDAFEDRIGVGKGLALAGAWQAWPGPDGSTGKLSGDRTASLLVEFAVHTIPWTTVQADRRKGRAQKADYKRITAAPSKR